MYLELFSISVNKIGRGLCDFGRRFYIVFLIIFKLNVFLVGININFRNNSNKDISVIRVG